MRTIVRVSTPPGPGVGRRGAAVRRDGGPPPAGAAAGQPGERDTLSLGIT
jgi:hypothetical protein